MLSVSDESTVQYRIRAGHNSMCAIARQKHGNVVLFTDRDETMRKLRQACGKAHGCQGACCCDDKNGRGNCRTATQCACVLVTEQAWKAFTQERKS